jgi:SpoVK/Ycf46/Vps4 family AAA+-type ATPase
LQTKYEQSFENVSFETVQPTFQDSVKRAVLFMRDNLDFIKNNRDPGKIHREFEYQHPKVQSIYKQLQVHARPMFKEFKQNAMNRIVQSMVRVESSNIDPKLDRLSVVLAKFLELHYDDFGFWQNSQPYRKMVALKYSLTRYEDFLRDTKIIFGSNHLEMPKEELEYLESVQSKFEHLQKQAQMALIEDKINTRWNWGRGFRSDEKNVKNLGVNLSVNLLDGGFFILVIWFVLLLFKNSV